MEQETLLRPSLGYPNHSLGASGEANASGVTWSAVIAGAFVTAALPLILLALGAGLGLSSVSPWSSSGISMTAVSAATILWLIVTELISSAMGGYLAGRLRVKWTSVHSDEVYFRDTAHGLLVWAVALVITAAFLTSAAASMLGASPATESNGRNRQLDPNAYFIDSLFRADSSKVDSITGPGRAEAGGIFLKGLSQGSLSAADSQYLAQLVVERTGLSPADAQRRVADVFSNAQQAAENARKALAHLLLWTFLALLIGAFFASFAATIGGRQRDHLVAV